ncbi:MAG: hypothetical protein J6T48_10220 [Bacteroidales bacterium]|nr:hypothetical protein [Bacteroidales bacterium]
MKKFLTISILCLSFLSAISQNFTTIEDLGAGWDKKTITGVKDGSILTLTKAFNKVWPTRPTADLLKNPVSNDGEGDYEIIVDSPNGYVSAFELGDDGESFSACVWKRNNGHRLFAFVFQKMHGLSISQIILFYDYDPAKGTLRPEHNELTNFVPSYGTDFHPLTYELPRVGKDIVVKEYFMNWYSSIEHIYKWDGMNHHFADVKIEKFDQMRKLYTDDNDEFEDSDFTKYTLYDFDEDGNPELWLSSQNEEYQAIYSIVQGEIQMLSSTYFKTNFVFYSSGAIGAAGGCGTGCFATQCVVLSDSKITRKCDEFQMYNFEKDKIENSYTIDGQDVSKKDGKQMFKSLGQAIEIKPDFRKLK